MREKFLVKLMESSDPGEPTEMTPSQIAKFVAKNTKDTKIVDKFVIAGTN
ncbi:hypothetical protein KIH39_04515 [Telmatocola sphagniphila]|uniref:Uncharacterized protein n=1 Tax=Telmatocola sphagniphila TaxID=1123043 RepID=A0A8E6EVX8_9BACT|nr:hypothetical protein [Telmatocola sphagniphila]QVL33187.1 hypothetical protein KIH39_04515 [Telmatocola sphagniphila]